MTDPHTIQPIDPNGVYTAAQLAIIFGRNPKTILRWELSGELPPSFPQGRERMWRGNVVLEYLDRKQRKAIEESQVLNVA